MSIEGDNNTSDGISRSADAIMPDEARIPKKKKMKRSDSNASTSSSGTQNNATVQSQMMAMEQYKRTSRHGSSRRSMTLSDSSSDSDDDGDDNVGSVRSHGSKKLPMKKRRRRTIESDGGSDDDSHAEEKPRSLALKKKLSKRKKQEDSFNNDDIMNDEKASSHSNLTSSSKKQRSNTASTTNDHQTNAPKRKRGGGYSQRITSSYGGAFNGQVPTPKYLTKQELKPKLQVNDAVYAAWWPDEESKRTNSQSSWYEGRVKSVTAVDQGSCEYGPTYYYSIEYDDGDELDQIRDVYVWPKADYLLCMKRKNPWIGVKGVQDKSAKDKWAKVTGWYVAEIDGVEYSFSLLPDALRAYDASVVRRKGETTKPSDLNLPREWEFSLCNDEVEFSDDEDEDLPSSRPASDSEEEEMISSSDFRGIHFHTGKNFYQANTSFDGKRYYLGSYKLASDAALAYDKAKRLLKGKKYVNANFVNGQEYQDARVAELQRTGLEVDLGKVEEYMTSKINQVVASKARASPSKNSSPASDSEEGEMLSSSDFRGVHLHKASNVFQANVDYKGKTCYMGSYKLASDGALAYDKALKQLKGQDVSGTNFASDEGHLCARALELIESGLEVDFEEVETYMSSKINNVLSKLQSTPDTDSVSTSRGIGESPGSTVETPKHKHAAPKKSSEYVGVSFNKERKKWQAYKRKGDKNLNFGNYTLESDAAYARDVAIKQLKIDLPLNFNRVQDYEDAKRLELNVSRLPADLALSSSEISSKVSEHLRKSAGKSLKSSTQKKSAVPPTECPEIAALNDAMAKKWEHYLPSTTGEKFLKVYQKSIDDMLSDLRNHGNHNASNGLVPSTVSIDNVSQPAGVGRLNTQAKSVKHSRDKMGVAAGSNEANKSLEQVQTESTCKSANVSNSRQPAETVRQAKKQISLSINEVELSEKKSMKSADSATQKAIAGENAHLNATAASAKSSTQSVASSSTTQATRKKQLIELTGVQVEGLGLPFRVGTTVWSRFDNIKESGASFQTGVITGCFLDLSSAHETIYRVKLGGGADTERIEMISEKELCFAPRSKVTVSRPSPDNPDTNNLLQGEILMCKANTGHQVNIQAVLNLKQSLADEQQRLSNTASSQTRENGKLLELLNELDKIPMSYRILQETLIGKSLKLLKTHHDNRVAQLTCGVVNKWKEIAANKNKGSTEENDTKSFVYTILIMKEGNQFHIEKNVSSDRVKHGKDTKHPEENESSNSTITSATGLC